MRTAKSAKKNQSVEKVIRIIEIMAHARGAMRLQDLAAAADLPASTALRFVNTLVENDYATQDRDTGRYGMTLKLCHVADLIKNQFDIRDVVRPYLVDLAEDCQESACLALEQDGMVVYADVADGPDSMLMTLQRIGKRAPMHSTGAGKTLLLDYDDASICALVAHHGLEAVTDRTITSRASLDTELIKVRRKGFAVDDEECEQGVRCIAAPLRDYTNRIVASISVSGPVARMSREKMTEVTNRVVNTATIVSKALGYESPKSKGSGFSTRR